MNPSKIQPTLLMVASLGILALFGLASLNPLHFWGINFQAYLPLYVGLIALGLPIAFTLGISATQNRLSALGNKLPSWTVSLAIAIGMWLLFYNVYIETQMYGDTRALLIALGKGGTESTKYHLAGALSPNIFSSKNGEQFTYSLIAGIQNMLGCSVWGAFRVLTAALGFIYAFLWMEFTQRKFKSLLMRVLVAVIGLTAGIVQVFYSHPEVYAAPVLVYTSYLFALVIFLEQREGKWLIALAVLLFFSIRTHSAGYTLAPTFAYALLAQWAGDRPERKQWLSWKKAGWMIPVACLAVGAIGYFTVFKAGAEQVDIQGRGKNIFLTLTGDKTPDNAYAMFSAWHFWDYFQEFLLCSAPSVAILLAWMLGLLRKDRWNAPAEIAVTIALILMGTLYFAIDPVLTMPRDWDLCGLIAPPLMVLAILWLARNEDTLRTAWIPLALLMGIAGLQATAVVVNHDVRAVHLRLIATAKHAFVSGHGGGCYFLRHSVDVTAFDQKARIQEVETALKEMLPYETQSNRSEYAFLCQYAGTLHFQEKNYQQALRHFNDAINRYPDEFQLYVQLGVVEMNLKQFEAALQHADLALHLPGDKRGAYDLAFDAAVALGRNEIALKYGEECLQQFKDMTELARKMEALRGASTPINADTLLPTLK